MSRSPIRRSLVPFVLLSGMHGCAGAPAGPGPGLQGGGVEPLAIERWAGVVDPSRCSAGSADPVPTPDALFAPGIPERLAAALPGSGSVVLSLSVDSTALERIDVVETTYVEGVTLALRDSLAAAFRPGPDAVSARIRLDGGPEPSVRTAPRWGCRPILANREEVSGVFSRLGALVPGGGRAVLWYRVAEDGRVVETRVEDSSGVGMLDALARSLAPQMRFHPAAIDRRPTAVWVQIPVSVSARSRPDAAPARTRESLEPRRAPPREPVIPPL